MDKTNEKKDNPKKDNPKKSNVRTTESLKKRGNRGKVLIVLRGAISLAAKNKFDGVEIKPGKGAGPGFLHRVSKETKGQTEGALWTADDEVINKIATDAAAANKDVNEDKYTASVKKFINTTYNELKGAGGGGRKVTPIVF